MLLLALSAGLSAQAQDFTRKGGISVNIGGEPALAGFNYDNSTADSQSLSGIYEPYTTSPVYSPLVSLTGEYILGRLFGIGADLCWTSYTINKFNGVTRKDLGETTVNGVIFMPSVRAYWLNRDKFKLYSGLYGGILFRRGRHLFQAGNRGHLPRRPLQYLRERPHLRHG